MKEKKFNPLKDKIINCAHRLLGEGGIQKLAQPQVAKDAEIPQGHLTYYFPTRADLILALAEKSIVAIGNLFASGNRRKATAKVAMPLIEKLLMDETRTRAMLGLVVETDQNPELLTKLNEQYARVEEIIAKGLGRLNKDPEVAATYAALLGLGLVAFIRRNEKNPPQVKRSLEVLFDAFESKT